MATTSYGVNAPEAVKLWSRALARETKKATYIERFTGEGSDSLIQIKSDTAKSAGDRITVTLRMLLTGDGIVGDQTLEGNEESLTTYTDNVVINQLRHAVRSQGKMSEQRIPWNIRDEAKNGLATWWAERYDRIFFNHICGYTPANTAGTQLGPAYMGANTITAPSTNRRMWQSISGSITADESLQSTDIFNLTVIDKAVEKAKTVSPLIRPINYQGDKYYVMFLHPYQVTDLRTNTSTGQWLDIQKAVAMGGITGKDKSGGNPIFSGALGVYNGVILHEAFRVTPGVNSSTGASVANTRRAVLCGAQTGFLANGKKGGFQEMDWNEQMFDYGNQLGVEAGSIFGIKKATFNSEDFGCITVSTYAAAH